MADAYARLKDLARPLIASWYSLVHGRSAFRFRDKDHGYFFHPYNSTWRNERAVEVPILRDFLDGVPESEILEIGNVTWHYSKSRAHDVVDLYEKGAGVRNVDVVTLEGPARYRRILAISTIEHVGYDETPRDPAKIARALKTLSDLLVPGGEMLVTIPIGYNPLLDADLRSGVVAFDELRFLRVTEGRWGWREARAEECWNVAFDQRLQAGRALAVGFLRKPVAV